MKTQSSLSNSSNNSVSAQATMDAHAPHLSIECDRSLNIAKASVLTERYRQAMKPGSRKAGFFGRNIIEKILSQEDCFGIRAYFAAEENGDSTIVLVGLDRSRRELIEGVLGEDILPCPPFCGQINSLNSNIFPFVKARKYQPLTFTGNENHRVTLAEARRLVGNFNTTDAHGLVGTDITKDALLQLIQSEVCAGMRVHFGRHSNGDPTMVFVGATYSGDDILNGSILEGRVVQPDREAFLRTLG